MSIVDSSSKKTLWSVTAITSHNVSLRQKKSLEFSESVLRSVEGLALLGKFDREVPYQAKLENGRAYLNVNNQKRKGELVWHEIRSLSREEIKRQSTQFVKLAAKCDTVFQKTHEARCAEDKIPRGRWSKVAERASVTSDCLSVVRNGFSVAEAATSSVLLASEIGSAVVPVLGMAGGMLSAGTGVFIAKSGMNQMIQSQRIGDVEGALLGASDVLMGGSLSGVGVGMVAADAAIIAPLVPLVATAMVNAIPVASGLAPVIPAVISPVAHQLVVLGAHAAPVITPLAFTLYGVLGLYAGYGIATGVSFRRELNRLSESEDGLYKSLVSLRAQVRGADSEEELKKKWNRFTRRTSSECCEMVRTRLTSEFLAKVEAGDETAINQAKELVAKVKIANGRQLVKNCVLLTIAILGILALVAAMVFSGPAAPALFVVGALLWLLIDSRRIHNLAAKTAYPDLGHSRKAVWKEEWGNVKQSAARVSTCVRSHLPTWKFKNRLNRVAV